MAKINDEKISKNSSEKMPIAVVIITNQKVSPAVTATDLKRGEESCIFSK